MTDKTGGPAFPSPTGNELQNGQVTVRDYFAAKAMAAIIERCHTSSHGIHYQTATVARNAYAIADAMLTEREA